jgi:hypothetical protein
MIHNFGAATKRSDVSRVNGRSLEKECHRPKRAL